MGRYFILYEKKLLKIFIYAANNSGIENLSGIVYIIYSIGYIYNIFKMINLFAHKVEERTFSYSRTY